MGLPLLTTPKRKNARSINVRAFRLRLTLADAVVCDDIGARLLEFMRTLLEVDALAFARRSCFLSV